jgi:hypothetical protein
VRRCLYWKESPGAVRHPSIGLTARGGGRAGPESESANPEAGRPPLSGAQSAGDRILGRGALHGTGCNFTAWTGGVDSLLASGTFFGGRLKDRHERVLTQRIVRV